MGAALVGGARRAQAGRWRIPTCWASWPCSASAPAAAVVYAALGALLGVVRLSELRAVMRRQPGVRPADPGEQP